MRPGTQQEQLIERYCGDMDALRARVDHAMGHGGSPVAGVDTKEVSSSFPSLVSHPLPKPDLHVSKVIRRKGKPRSTVSAVKEIDQAALDVVRQTLQGEGHSGGAGPTEPTEQSSSHGGGTGTGHSPA